MLIHVSRISVFDLTARSRYLSFLYLQIFWEFGDGLVFVVCRLTVECPIWYRVQHYYTAVARAIPMCVTTAFFCAL